MPEAFNINLDSLTEEEYYNFLVRWYVYCFEHKEYQPEQLIAFKQALEIYEGETK